MSAMTLLVGVAIGVVVATAAFVAFVAWIRKSPPNFLPW
jgi:hypothetical protein